MVSLQDRLTKLQTLEEDLENVSLQDTPSARKQIKRSPSSQLSLQSHPLNPGLGLSVPARRPSDTMLKKQNSSKVSILDRPVSNDSITSTAVFSEFSEYVNDSRNSSMTSGSVGNSPMIQNTTNLSNLSIDQSSSCSSQVSQSTPQPNLRHAISTPRLYTSYQSSSMNGQPAKPNLSTSQLSNVSNTSLSTLQLTPSQKYRLKRQNSKSSSRSTLNEREKFYNDSLNLNDDDYDEDDGGLIWNVPYTKGSGALFSPLSGKNPKLIKTIINESPVLMPMSPLPGNISAPSSPMVGRLPKSNSTATDLNTANNNGYFYRQPDEAQSLSHFYQMTSDSYVKRELSSRVQSSINLPTIIKEASNLGLDDLKLISEEKAKTLSSTRPIWLPPKPVKESFQHEKDVNKMFEEFAKLSKEKKELSLKQKAIQEKNKSRWNELVKRGIKRNSTQSEMKKLAFKTKIPDHSRYQIWSVFLNVDSSATTIETYDELNTKLKALPNLPVSKIDELSELIKDLTEDKEVNSKLIHLLKLLMISKISMIPKFDEILLYLLLLKFNEIDSFNLFYMVKSLTFNETNMKKFDGNLYKNSVLKREFKSVEYKEDLKQLSSSKIMEILIGFGTDNIDLIYQFFDIVVLNHHSYKNFYVLMLVVLKEYHFGFNSLTELTKNYNDDLKINVDDNLKFFERFTYYYRKFF